ncbi:long-chain-fatty-acid--CoA ligase 6 isoform X4 [Phyllopteryx taeniolatus]|uniref:long-chain-fatty-acid--CoA ligase 6 isoform X4 n=1 Tax=Phyllopteryx taeniolatus TaxID=161469 RepID=UPI002AD4555B|nr:long-chain-fatty-acid--CoA ligase 6 isoform X4 [Phyllopteryx taeniolatus]
MLAFVLVSGSLWILLELSSTLMEKMQAQEMLSGLRVPDMDDLGRFFSSLPTSTLVGIGALAAVLAYWLATRPRPIKPPCSLLHQSEEVPHEGGGRRSMMCDHSKLLTHYHDDARTMYEVFQRGLHISGDGPCLGSRLPNQPYKWMSYKEVTSRAEHLGSGLLYQGCKASPDQFIGVFAQNRPEWIISELACYTYSMVVVPLYDTLGPDAIRFIINTADISTVICDKVEKAQVLLANVERAETPALRRIVLMDVLDSALVERGHGCGVHVQAMQEVEALGRDYHRKPLPPSPDDLSIVCFTSGTTGNPKGVMLTHGNVVADFSGFLKVTDKVIFPNQDDCLISFLPLAHMFERLIEIFSQANSPLKRCLLNFAAKRKGAEVSSGIIRSNSVWDKIFFSKIQASLGGRLRMIITGAAPTSPTVLGFLRAALGCQVYEAYGQTECTAGCTFTTPGDWTPGHVGAPLPCNLIKLVDVPEKNYFAAKGEGEVCVKGPNVFMGYLKDPERTAETLDPDGWLHTGDIGKWLPNGTLKIVDRKKHIFKLAQGEYISPEKIENIYIRSEPVAQLYVHGDSLQSCLVGIVVPDTEVMPMWAKKKGILGTYKDLCKNTELKKAILEDLVRLGKASSLHSFEQVKNIYIHSEMFSIENGLLTPTLKAKRPELREFFKEKIEQLYSAISM